MIDPARDSSRRALHAVMGFGSASETFIVDRMLELDRLGWEASVGAKWMVDEPLYEFPPSARVFAPRPRDELLRKGQPWRRGRDWWWLERPIGKVRPTLIHAHFGWTALEALGAAEHYGIPLAAGFHGYDATVYPRYGFDAHDDPAAVTMPAGVYDDLFCKAGCIFATSNFIASKLRDLGCSREIDVVSSGIRLESFPFRGPRPDAAADELRLLFIARLVPYKGLDLVLEALATLANGGSVAPTLTVIGEGPARKEYEDLAARLEIASLVDFRGRQPRSAVTDALWDADVLVLPSRTTPAGQAEGLGNVVKEALAVGLEVAISDNGGLSETMPPERQGELVAEGDATALAQRLDAIAAGRGDWEERAHSGRRWVETTFDWRKQALRIDEVYRRLSS